jgi:hypothetical protein
MNANSILNPETIAALALATRPRRAADGWLPLALLWLLALGFVGLTSANFHDTAIAADRYEAIWRQPAKNTAGRGACEAFSRAQPPLMFDPDSLCWINLTQLQWRQGVLRPHDFPFDNTPFGRERHWSSSFSWWLLLLGGATHTVTGAPMESAIAQAAAWANPALFALFLTALTLILRRRLDAWTTGVFVVTLAALWGVEWDFAYGRPDHHGLHLMAFTGMILAAMIGGMGWVRESGESVNEEEDRRHLARPAAWKHARRWFAVSGVCGGAGLWIGATQQCIGIGALGAGAALGALVCARPAVPGEEGVRFAPELWRLWARVGAAASLAFYLLEYFPDHLPMRLEINHPFFALAWLGGGELIWAAVQAKLDWKSDPRRRIAILRAAALGLVCLSVMPLAMRFGPKDWFWLRDPILLRSARLISEGKPWIANGSILIMAGEFWNYAGVLWLGLPLGVGALIFQRQAPPHRRATILAALLMALLFLAWTLFQRRWMGFMETSLAALALAVAPCLPVPRRTRAMALPLWLLALAAPGWAGYCHLQIGAYSQDPLLHARALTTEPLALKEAAWNLRLYSDNGGARPARVMAPLESSPALHYYGGVETVGSYYWENLAAWHATVDFFADEGGDAARRIARERGLDFVLVMARPSFVFEMQTLKTGRAADMALAQKTLAFRLANPRRPAPPDWLEPLPLLDAPLADANGVRLYRVLRDRL